MKGKSKRFVFLHRDNDSKPDECDHKSRLTCYLMYVKFCKITSIFFTLAICVVLGKREMPKQSMSELYKAIDSTALNHSCNLDMQINAYLAGLHAHKTHACLDCMNDLEL